MFHPSFLDQLDNPAWVKIDAEADAATVLSKMFDRQSKPSWARRAKHQPVCTLREIFFRESLTEFFVIGSEVPQVNS